LGVGGWPGARRSMRALKLVIAYDGTDFVGWQRQPEGVSVQRLVEDALAPLAQSAVSVVAAGRTDAGVHATGQVASVQLESRLDAQEIGRALNAQLPPAVRVLRADEAASGFHARFDARAKTYEYRLVNAPVASPFAVRYAWHVPVHLDLDRMIDAARRIEGTHDFACFQSTGGSAARSVRTVHGSELMAGGPGTVPAMVPEPVLRAGRLLVYRITGDGFLRHMVRSIVGTLVEIGRGAGAPERIDSLLASGTRAAAGPTAPACGLCLVGVSYDPPEMGGA
jgi:tRNA pseudouridine38-40 synthase